MKQPLETNDGEKDSGFGRLEHAADQAIFWWTLGIGSDCTVLAVRPI